MKLRSNTDGCELIIKYTWTVLSFPSVVSKTVVSGNGFVVSNVVAMPAVVTVGAIVVLFLAGSIRKYKLHLIKT